MPVTDTSKTYVNVIRNCGGLANAVRTIERLSRAASNIHDVDRRKAEKLTDLAVKLTEEVGAYIQHHASSYKLPEAP